MSASKIIDRCTGVKATGKGRWMVQCPAHQDRSASLSIRELDDGRILINDFGGCDTQSVLDAIGLSMSDLFPDGGKGNFKASHSRIPARDILMAIGHETTVLLMVMSDFMRTGQLNDSDREELARCIDKIERAHAYANA